MKLSNRRLWLFGAIAIGVIILITFLAAPANNKLNNGSTYNRSPDGYGAWYAFMSKRGTPVKRWQKPFEDLVSNQTDKRQMTLLRVNSGLSGSQPFENEQNLAGQLLSGKERDWVKKGNTLVILGVRQSVTEAPYSSTHKAGKLSVKIDTQRREKNAQERLLGDRFGAIVWEQSLGKGRIIFATTPHLAANAYQDFQGNYEFLAQMVTQSRVEENVTGGLEERTRSNRESQIPNSVWVDEYIHGYKDSEVIKREYGQTLFGYLVKTPVFPALVQGLILLLVAIWAGNRRFGKPVTLAVPVVDNSQAYIQALAGVLQKANSSDFIVEVVGKEEQLQLQKALFLGQAQLDEQSLVTAWVQQTGRSANELEQLLQMQSQKRRISETDLLSWLEKWQKIHRL